jgi:hypothetical protein
MAIEVFNRYENKYVIDEAIFDSLEERLLAYLTLDPYNHQKRFYPICNIYYDTDDNHLIRLSLSKPDYKEKLRLRSYGTPTEESEVFVEIKKKVGGLVNKRRSTLRLKESYEFLKSGKMPEMKSYMNKQVLQEIQYILRRHPLKKAVFISYERRAFFGKDSADVRISFDTNIIARREDLDLASCIRGERILPEGKLLMEVKTAGAIPVWLTRVLSEFQIYPKSFSKYGTEYTNTLTPSAPYAVYENDFFGAANHLRQGEVYHV